MKINKLNDAYMHQVTNCAKLKPLLEQWGDSLQWIIVYELKKEYDNMIVDLSAISNTTKESPSNSPWKKIAQETGISQQISESFGIIQKKGNNTNFTDLPKLLDFCIENHGNKQLSLEDIIKYNLHINLFSQFGIMIDELIKDYAETETAIKELEAASVAFDEEMKKLYEKYKEELRLCINTIYVNSNLVKNKVFFIHEYELEAFENMLKYFGLWKEEYAI